MKKIIKNILLFATIITSVFVACTVVQAENKYQDGDYTYTVEFGKATLVKYTGNSLDIIVPSVLGGKPLVEIENGAFYNNNYINSVVLPDTVKKWGRVFLTVKKKTVALKKGQSYTISYSAVPAGKAVFKSSDAKCVTVNANGKIVAKRKGTAIISVSCNNIIQKIKVTVQ